MNEISRYCRLLGVKSGASVGDLKKAYRDLVQVWHPDRFGENERLRLKAEEHLKEINLAHDYLMANAFRDGILVEPPEETPSSPLPSEQASSGGAEAGMPAPSETPGQKSGLVALVVVMAVVLLAGASFLYLRAHWGKREPVATSGRQPEPSPATAPAQTNTSFSADLLATMVPINGEEVSKGREGVNLNSSLNQWERIQTRELISPPFAVRTRIKSSELNDIRFYYGVGRLIFNWEDRPGELCVLSVLDGKNTPVPGRGKLMPDAWHEVVWEITKATMRISVDGETRFEKDGNYANLKGYPGIGPHIHGLTVQSFVLEMPQAPTPAATPPRAHAPPGDMLAALVPEKNVRTASRPDGLLLTAQPAGDVENCLKTDQPIHAPFTVRTRAKTDSTNVRLYGMPGWVIFNWEQHPADLLLGDPIDGKRFQIDGKGLVSPNEWHEFVWDIQPDRMILSVDGEVRFQRRGDYRKVQIRPGIASAWSRVTVDYFVVDKK